MASTHLFYFAQGGCGMFFLILGTLFLVNGESRLKKILGCILIVWFLQVMKDLFFLNSAVRTDEYYVNLLLSIDLFAMPTGTFFLFELLKPNTVTWRTVVVHESLFVGLILLYAITGDASLYYFILSFGILYGLSIVYFVLKRMKSYNQVLENNYSNTDTVNVRWLRMVAVLLVACMLVWTITSFYVTYWGDICYYFFCCYIWGFIAWRTEHQEIASQELFEEKESSNLQMNNKCLVEQLDRTLKDNKLYLNPKLTLADVSKELGTNRTYLSACLNNELCTTFYDYINSFRLKEVEWMFRDENNINCSIEELSLKCGFNSISTFRRAFVKMYGCTPLQYRRNLLKSTF